MPSYVIGIDFGTLSARAVILNAITGKEAGSCAKDYPHGVLDRALPSGAVLKDQSALQDPRDYLAVLAAIVPGALADAGLTPQDIAGMCIDFTTCTMLPVHEEGSPLRNDPEFRNNPHAWVKLWKHHASQPEADQITALAAERGEEWLPYYGGKISSEWMLPKILEIYHDSPELYRKTDIFIEAGDWLSYLLTERETHAPGMAALKANFAPDLGFPSKDFLHALEPGLTDLYKGRVCPEVKPITEIAGKLTEKGAELCGLIPGIPLALPVLDAGAAMPAVGITGEGELLMILGTSGVLLLNHKERIPVPGICGCMKEGLLPGYYSYEAGLAGLGDVFDWFVKNCVPASYTRAAKKRGISVHQLLREKSIDMKPGRSGLIALDWLCGNRSVLKDADLSGMILGLTLTTRPEEIYRALIEATAFGMKRALEAFTDAGIQVHTVYAAGGIARKDEMLMQIYADVLECDIVVPETTQAGALGSCIYAAVAGGIYPDLTSAIKALASPAIATYHPTPEHLEDYRFLYEQYKLLHDYFGQGENPVMKALSAMRKRENG